MYLFVLLVANLITGTIKETYVNTVEWWAVFWVQRSARDGDCGGGIGAWCGTLRTALHIMTLSLLNRFGIYTTYLSWNSSKWSCKFMNWCYTFSRHWTIVLNCTGVGTREWNALRNILERVDWCLLMTARFAARQSSLSNTLFLSTTYSINYRKYYKATFRSTKKYVMLKADEEGKY